MKYLFFSDVFEPRSKRRGTRFVWVLCVVAELVICREKIVVPDSDGSRDGGLDSEPIKDDFHEEKRMWPAPFSVRWFFPAFPRPSFEGREVFPSSAEDAATADGSWAKPFVLKNSELDRGCYLTVVRALRGGWRNRNGRNLHGSTSQSERIWGWGFK